jgi:integrase
MPGEFVRERNSLPRRKITHEEFEALVKVADENFRDVLICGYESGMRSSEICDLRVYQVHLDVQHISGAIVDYIDLGEFDTKTGARRTVPVSEELKGILKGRVKGLESEDHIFADEKGIPYNNDKICKRFARCCRRAGLPQGDKLRNEKGERIGLVFHCLRHTRTTTWVEMGFSDEIIRRATGHKSLEAYHKYIHLDASVVMRLVDNSKRHKNGIKSPQSVARA